MKNKNISFILHKPQLSENIGSSARAIKNFNFHKLIIIDPKPLYPNDKILATSVGAKDIIRKSEVYKTLDFLIISFAPTDVANILSFGYKGLGSIIINL